MLAVSPAHSAFSKATTGNCSALSTQVLNLQRLLTLSMIRRSWQKLTHHLLLVLSRSPMQCILSKRNVCFCSPDSLTSYRSVMYGHSYNHSCNFFLLCCTHTHIVFTLACIFAIFLLHIDFVLTFVCISSSLIIIS
jgi:hypothetical protein